MKNISLICVITLLALSAASLSACNTAKGFGKDMEKAGESIQNM